MDVEVTREDIEVADRAILIWADACGGPTVAAIAAALSRSTAHATGFAECREMAAVVAERQIDGHEFGRMGHDLACRNIAQAIRALKPSPDPAKEGGDE